MHNRIITYLISCFFLLGCGLEVMATELAAVYAREEVSLSQTKLMSAG